MVEQLEAGSLCAYNTASYTGYHVLILHVVLSHVTVHDVTIARVCKLKKAKVYDKGFVATPSIIELSCSNSFILVAKHSNIVTGM